MASRGTLTVVSRVVGLVIPTLQPTPEKAKATATTEATVAAL